MLKFQAQVYRINDIAGWNERRELRLAPDFQRRTVWSPRGKSFLIDSIMRGMPLPQFFIREIVIPREKRTVREVVDGQQRLTTILGYLSGDFTMMPIHNSRFAKLQYEELPEEAQKEFLSFPLSVNVLQETEDKDVLEIFSRLNSYSVPLNNQEKLNAQFVGDFSKSVSEMARLHLAFWKRHRILTAQNIARMRDIELTAELVGAMLRGLQAQKKIIASLYREFDAEFPQQGWIAERFATTLQACEDLVGGYIEGTVFRRSSVFYSLFAAVYDAKFGLGSESSTIERSFTRDEQLRACDDLIGLSDAIEREDVTFPRVTDFLMATKQSTDKLPQRTARHLILVGLLRASRR